MHRYAYNMHHTVVRRGTPFVIELDDLRGFVEVVESGGFNRAAKRLGVSKSVVSRRIARLEADLGARLLSPTTRGIAPVRSVFVASPAYLARNGQLRTPSDLAAHQCLLYTGRVAADWQFYSGKRSISFRPEGRLRSDSGEAILEWAIAGLGITEAPSFMVSDAIESGTLEPLLLDYPTPEYAIHVVRPPGSYVPGKVRVLIDTLVERLGGEPEWERFLTKRE